MIAFLVDAQSNDSYAFRDRPAIREDTPWYELHQAIVPSMSGAPRPGVRRCSTCGALLSKWDEQLTGMKIKKRYYDISRTYDGIMVVSAHFKEIYESKILVGLRFVSLPEDVDLFQIKATEIVPFDAERRGTRFEKQCPSCGHFESVVGATPVYLKEGSVIPDFGFVRTDLEFATADEQHPLFLCGLSAGRILRSAKLRGLDLEKVYL